MQQVSILYHSDADEYLFYCDWIFINSERLFLFKDNKVINYFELRDVKYLMIKEYKHELQSS